MKKVLVYVLENLRTPYKEIICTTDEEVVRKLAIQTGWGYVCNVVPCEVKYDMTGTIRKMIRGELVRAGDYYSTDDNALDLKPIPNNLCGMAILEGCYWRVEDVRKDLRNKI